MHCSHRTLQNLCHMGTPCNNNLYYKRYHVYQQGTLYTGLSWCILCTYPCTCFHMFHQNNLQHTDKTHQHENIHYLNSFYDIFYRIDSHSNLVCKYSCRHICYTYFHILQHSRLSSIFPKIRVCMFYRIAIPGNLVCTNISRHIYHMYFLHTLQHTWCYMYVPSVQYHT